MLQSTLIAFAPAIVGTITITELLNMIGKYWESALWQEWVLLGGMFLAILTIMMVAFPSRADFKRILEHMVIRPISTLRQIMVCIGSYFVFYFTWDYLFALFPWNPFYLEPLILIGMIASIEIAYVLGTFIFQQIFQHTFNFNPKLPKLTAIQPSDLVTLASKKSQTTENLVKDFNSEFKMDLHIILL
jgi:hypothetical protein